MPEFLNVITADQMVDLLGRFGRLSSQRIPLDASLDRFLFEDIITPEDLPERPRSTVDGYAVRAADTFGASDSIPAFLEVVAAVPMGVVPDAMILPGQAAQIPTGGFLPEGADAVVMVEYTNPAGSNAIEVIRPVTAKANVLDKGEDAKRSEILLLAGKSMRPQEIGFLAALGITEIRTYRQPQVAVISSGDEVVSIDRKPQLGQIRDANSHSLAALVRASGAEPISFEIAPDNAGMMGEMITSALSIADVVAISGGSSVGTRDLMVEAVADLPGVEILAHGVAIRPGKPTMLAHQNGKAIFGLPGHPVSALVVAQIFMAPFLRFLQGGKLEKGPLGSKTEAELATSISSTVGLEEFIRVRLDKTSGGTYFAYPVFGKSGMLSTMVKADGIIAIPMNSEGLSKGEKTQVARI